jgi:hypothetical protein
MDHLGERGVPGALLIAAPSGSVAAHLPHHRIGASLEPKLLLCLSDPVLWRAVNQAAVRSVTVQ